MNPPPFSPSAERNKQPILQVLQGFLPPAGRALEIASGTGQHAAWFTAALPQWHWQTSDFDAAALPGIAHWLAQGAAADQPAPVRIDVCSAVWPSQDAEFPGVPFDLVYCANMLHIAPWSCCIGLMQGCDRYLAPNGRLVVYGPFLETDVSTSQGNRVFDHDLRARNPAWGLRSVHGVQAQAASVGLALVQRHAMPSNNLLLVFERQPG
jgi:SAM-dependent methyltransferase